MSNSGRARRYTAIISVILLLVSLIPLLIASFYAHPVLDDLNYSASTHDVILAGGGFGEVIQSILVKVKATWHDWQGSYASVFLFVRC